MAPEDIVFQAMPATVRTSELNSTHLRRTVTIEGDGWSITGRLDAIAADAEVDEFTTHTYGTVRERVRPVVRLKVGPFEFTAAGDETVTLLS